MTIGGIPITEAQFAVLDTLRKHGVTACSTVNRRTGSALMGKGLVEMFTPEARTYSMAVRGRVRYYRLSAAGREAVASLKRTYKRR